MAKRVLVTGVAGFIGSHVAQACLDEGWEVTGIDDLSNGHKEFIPKSVQLIERDFADPVVLSGLSTMQYDTVFHLAANARVPYSVEHPIETNENNVTKTLKLIDACKGHIRRFVFSSSCSVYGNAIEIPTTESCKPSPRSPYALQKLVIEEYLKLYAQLYHFDAVCLRYFNVYGPHQIGGSPYATAVGNWLGAIINGEPLRFDGDGSQERDMVYVKDVAQANVLASKFVRSFSDQMLVCNIGTETKISNSQILSLLGIKFGELSIQYAPVRQGDVKVTQADIMRACEYLEYSPQYTFEKGLRETIEWAMTTPYMKTLRSTKG